MGDFEDVAGRARALLGNLERLAARGAIVWQPIEPPEQSPDGTKAFTGRFGLAKDGTVTVIRYLQGAVWVSRGMAAHDGLAVALYPPDSDTLFEAALRGSHSDGSAGGTEH